MRTNICIALAIAFITVACGDQTTEPAGAVVDEIILTMSKSTIDVGDHVSVSAEVYDTKGRLNSSFDTQVRWSNSNAAVVSLTTYGNSASLQGLSPGSTTVTASVQGVSQSQTVQVTAPAGQVAFAVASPSILPVTVYLDNVQVGIITTALTSYTCGSPGAITLTRPVGTYSVRATSPRGTFTERTITAVKNRCSTLTFVAQ